MKKLLMALSLIFVLIAAPISSASAELLTGDYESNSCPGGNGGIGGSCTG